MAFLLFIDESGHDHGESPYEVLAGIAVDDARTWNLITAIQAAEIAHFGQRITHGALELKAKKLLKRKTYRLAAQMAPFSSDDRRLLAQECLAEGRAAVAESRPAKVSRAQLTALAQAKLAFVQALITTCTQHGVRAFASIVDDGPRPISDFLRKDYSYLFERFFYFLEAQHPYHQGIVIFDELEKTQSHLLVDQMCRYFQETVPGKARASRIIPEPMFVHSDLTSLVQVADIVAYVVSWAVRLNEHMNKPVRPELESLAKAVSNLKHRTSKRTSKFSSYSIKISSFKFIQDLRSQDERQSGSFPAPQKQKGNAPVTRSKASAGKPMAKT